MTHDGALIRAVLVDDEALARRGIRQLLAAHPDVAVVAECRNGREALDALEAHSPDLMFLDVQMPEFDGFDVMREALVARGAEGLPVTVFLTAFEEFALDAFGVDATDYLVKPASDERFDTTMQRVRRRLATAATSVPRTAGAGESGTAQHLVIASTQGQRVVPLDEIEWIGADDYYVAIHAGGRRHLLRESMASLEARLDATRFVRVHRGAMVNVTRIREVRTAAGDTVVILRDGTRLPVSRRRRSALLTALG
jgi:two-component system LytT family response regulator